MRYLTSLLIVVVLALCAGPAQSQSDAEKARAEKLFNEGKALMETKKYGSACAKFEESYELVKGVGAQYFLARCLTELGKTGTAYRHFEEVAEISARVGQQERADVARERMRELEPRLMKIRVDVTTRTPGLELECDGKAIPEAMWGKPLPYDPGPHIITARIPDKAPWERNVELTKEGSVRTVVVPDLESAIESPIDDTSESDPAMSLLISGIAVGGLGVVGLAIGGGMAGAAKSTYDDSDAFCDELGCDQQGLDLVDDARSLGDGATVVFVIGGVLLAGGATMVVLSLLQDDDEATGLAPEIRLGPAAGSLRWRF